YDLVVLDSSPVLALSDTGQLARLVDQCVVVVEWRRTPAKAVATALKRLKEIKAQIAGFVLSRVDIREYAKLDSSGLRYCLDYYPGRAAQNRRRRPAWPAPSRSGVAPSAGLVSASACCLAPPAGGDVGFGLLDRARVPPPRRGDDVVKAARARREAK